MLDGAPRSATVVAMSDALLALPREDFMRHLHHPDRRSTCGSWPGVCVAPINHRGSGAAGWRKCGFVRTLAADEEGGVRGGDGLVLRRRDRRSRAPQHGPKQQP